MSKPLILELKEKIIGKVLFESVNGDNSGDITLKDAISNYNEVKIDYVVLVGDYVINESKRTIITDENYISLSGFMAHSNQLQLLHMGRYLFSGTSVKRVHETRSRISSNNTTGWDGTSTGIYITKITGYKY